MDKCNPSKSKIAIIVLVILLILTVGYIVADKYASIVYNRGAQAGYEYAIVQVAQQAATCQQVPLIVGNSTINVVAVECLQQAAESS